MCQIWKLLDGNILGGHFLAMLSFSEAFWAETFWVKTYCQHITTAAALRIAE